MATTVQDTTDYLDEDTVVPNGQRFALVSFVGPECRQKTEKFGIKIRGCFGTREEASAHVKRLQAIDGRVDIFMLEVGKWALAPPSPSDVNDVEYQEEYLQNLMKEYLESQEKAKAAFASRTQNVMKEGLDTNLLPDEVIPRPKEEDLRVLTDDQPGPSGTQ